MARKYAPHPFVNPSRLALRPPGLRHSVGSRLSVPLPSDTGVYGGAGGPSRSPATRPVSRPVRATAPAAPPVVKRPTRPIDPGLAAINATEQRHIGQATKARDWLANIVATLQATQAQQNNTTTGLLGASAGSLQAAGNATSPYIQSISPGGYIPQLPPQAALGKAAAQQALTPSIRQNLAFQAGTDVGASLISQAAKYATELPGVYSEKRTKYMADLAAFREQVRQFNVAQTNRGLAQQADLNAKMAIANANNATDVAIADANNATRMAIHSGQVAIKPGSYKGLSAKDYSKNVGGWVPRAEKLLTIPRKIGVDENGDPVMGTQDPGIVFDMMVSANIRPADALKVIGNVATVNPMDAYKWLLKYLPKKNAQAVLKQIAGVDLYSKPRVAVGLGD